MFCEIRELKSSDLDELLACVRSDLVSHLFVASRANELLSHRSSTSILGYFENGKLISGLLYGPNLVPINLTDNSCVELTKFLGQLTYQCASIVGPKRDVENLWEHLKKIFPTPRLIRETQILFKLEEVLPEHPDSKVRLVTEADLDGYVAASIEMFIGEVGLTPHDLVDYRHRVRTQILAKNSYGWFSESGRVLFKVDVGSQINGICQLQGVWLHPELRGRGFSVQLLHMAINFIQREHAKTVTLYVNEFNKPAVALYERLGFVKHNEFQTIFF